MHEADLAALAPLAASYTVYVEVPWAEDPAPKIAHLAAHGLRAKLRTGGVVADAIPPTAAVARFIAACQDAKVRFKATAGLHHAARGDYPLTYEPGSARATMHGFLNVLAAGTVTAGADESEFLERMLEGVRLACDNSAFAAKLIADARVNGMQSFGSCSFDEPVAELTERGLI